MRVILNQCLYTINENTRSYLERMYSLPDDQFLNAFIIESSDMDEEGALNSEVRELMLTFFKNISNINQRILKLDLLSRQLKLIETYMVKYSNIKEHSADLFNTCLEILDNQEISIPKKYRIIEELIVKAQYGFFSPVWIRINALGSFISTLFLERSWSQAKESYFKTIKHHLAQWQSLKNLLEVQKILGLFFLILEEMLAAYPEAFRNTILNKNAIETMVKEAQIYKKPEEAEWCGLTDMESIPGFFNAEDQITGNYQFDTRINAIERLKPQIKKSLQIVDPHDVKISDKEKVIVTSVIWGIGIRMNEKFRQPLQKIWDHSLLPFEFKHKLSSMFQSPDSNFPEISSLMVNYLENHVRTNTNFRTPEQHTRIRATVYSAAQLDSDFRFHRALDDENDQAHESSHHCKELVTWQPI